jgi:Glycosyl hydrolase family 47
VAAGALEDGMESFFLAETAKYLFLLFTPAPSLANFLVLSTEGHLFPVLSSPDLPGSCSAEAVLEAAEQRAEQAVTAKSALTGVSHTRHEEAGPAAMWAEAARTREAAWGAAQGAPRKFCAALCEAQETSAMQQKVRTALLQLCKPRPCMTCRPALVIMPLCGTLLP